MIKGGMCNVKSGMKNAESRMVGKYKLKQERSVLMHMTTKNTNTVSKL